MQKMTFVIQGQAATAGSKKSFRHSKTGKIVTLDTCKRKPAWQAQCISSAVEAMMDQGWKLSRRPIRLNVCFFFARPKSHFRTGKFNGLLRSGFEAMQHTQKPDVTKLVRCLEDSFKGIVWQDDSQVVAQNTSKSWAASNFVRVEIQEIED